SLSRRSAVRSRCSASSRRALRIASLKERLAAGRAIDLAFSSMALSSAQDGSAYRPKRLKRDRNLPLYFEARTTEARASSNHLSTAVSMFASRLDFQVAMVESRACSLAATKLSRLI